MSRVYIASKFENSKAVRQAMDKFEAAGHEIARDWTQHVPWDWNNPDEVAFRAPGVAMEDYIGVMRSEVFVFLTPTDPEQARAMIGAYVEMGIALGASCDPEHSRYVYMVGKQYYNTFSYLPYVHVVDTVEEVIANLSMSTLSGAI